MFNSIYSDNHILVVDKPAGFPVLPDGWEPESPYMVKILQEIYGKIWVVHRLDKVSSGVIIFALTPEAHRHLNLQFERREISKIYHVIVNDAPAWADNIVDLPLRTNVGRKHRTIVDYRGGKPAETHFLTLERYPSTGLVEARPLTGRTHQIRAHAASMGHPLLADSLYDAPSSDLIDRPALHAKQIRFVHPINNEEVQFSSPYPDDFKQALKMLHQ